MAAEQPFTESLPLLVGAVLMRLTLETTKNQPIYFIGKTEELGRFFERLKKDFGGKYGITAIAEMHIVTAGAFPWPQELDEALYILCASGAINWSVGEIMAWRREDAEEVLEEKLEQTFGNDFICRGKFEELVDRFRELIITPKELREKPANVH